MSSATIRHLKPGDEALVHAASFLFDYQTDAEQTLRFLADPLHYLLIAYLDEVPVGFVSGTRILHPDKQPQMFLNELAVDEGARNQGIGRALVRELARITREYGCSEMWVLTSPDNAPALATYRAAGAIADDEKQVMLTIQLDETQGQ